MIKADSSLFLPMIKCRKLREVCAGCVTEGCWVSVTFRWRLTFVKELPSLTCGVVGNSLFLLMVSEPASRLYRLDITSNKSDVVFTGRKRLRGTFTPRALLKLLMAAPTAVSSWMTFSPPFRVCRETEVFSQEEEVLTGSFSNLPTPLVRFTH